VAADFLAPANAGNRKARFFCHGTTSQHAEEVAARSAFKFIARLGEAGEATPDAAIHCDDHERDYDGGQQQKGEAAAVGGRIDLRAEADFVRIVLWGCQLPAWFFSVFFYFLV
jgi:hypothetical protein